MKAARTVEIKMQSGVVTLDIEVTRELREEIAYADGYNIPMGKKVHESMKITILHNGKKVDDTNWMPAVIRTVEKKSYPATAYAILGGKVILTEGNYNLVTEAINAATAEVENAITADTEYADVKASEIAKKAIGEANLRAAEAHYTEQLKNGLCPKCGTYCYGDCGA